MKMIIAPFVLLLLASASCAEKALACGEANGKVRVYSLTEDGIKHDLILDSAAVDRTPTWAPGSGEPPLSVSKAVATVTAWAKQRYPNADEVRVRSVKLESFQCSYNHWYYRIDLLIVANGKGLSAAANFAGVLMDATIVEPLESK